MPRSDAFARECLAYADTLHNTARYLTGSTADAEDLVQETYVRAFHASDQFAPGSHLKAWLFRILRNTFIDVYRRRKNDPTRARAGATDPPEAEADENMLRGDIELERLRGVVAEEIEAALMTLTEDSRTVVLLDLEGLSEVEIAEVMGCPVGTVKSRLFRARAALRQRLQDYAR